MNLGSEESTGTLKGVFQFIEHEPGPRGSPQLPQGLGDAAKPFCELPTAKLESC